MPDALPVVFGPALAALGAWLQAARIPGIVIGGVAASLLGRPRFTQDIDALVSIPENGWQAALDSAGGHGLVPRIDDPLGFARRTRVLLLRHAATGVDVDVVIGGLPFETEAIEHGVDLAVGGHRLRVARVEDLLVMKAIAHRSRDLADIENLLAANPHVDIARCRRVVGEFAAASLMPELLTDFDRLIESAHRDPGTTDE